MKYLSKVVVICLLLLLSGCAREAGPEDSNESILESEVATTSIGEESSEVDAVAESEGSFIEDMVTEENVSEAVNEVDAVNEIVLERFQIDSGFLCVTDNVEGYGESEEYHQIYANFLHDEVVEKSIYLGDFYYYPEYQSITTDYKFLVTSVNEKYYFLYQVMAGIEGPGVDYFLFEICGNNLIEERSVLDPGYSDGRQLYDVTGIDKGNYYTEGITLTGLADKRYEKVLVDLFSPYNISAGDLLIRPEW